MLGDGPEHVLAMSSCRPSPGPSRAPTQDSFFNLRFFPQGLVRVFQGLSRFLLVFVCLGQP